MNDFVPLLLWSLGRTTLWLAVAALVTTLLLRIARPSWPAAHRLAWFVVLLVGWSFIRLPLTVPWYEAQLPEPTAIVELAPSEVLVQREPQVEVIELAPLSDEVLSTAPAPIASAAVVQSPVQNRKIDWPLVLLGAWALGGAALVSAWGIGYVMFVRSLAARVPVGEVHQAEWHELLAAAGVRREIPLCTTEKFGPLLCRLPRGYEIIVPESLWRELTARERTAILRHELAHYQRGDVWTSLVARVLALAHWFNPAAWWAARQFDEAAEWACDRAAAGEDATTDYANALVRLGQVGPRATFYGTAARGRSLAARIRRVLSGPTTEDSLMKKASLIAIVLCLAAASVVQIDLVAQQPTAEVKKSAEETEPIKTKAPLGDEQPAPRPTTSPYLNLLQSKKAPADGREAPADPKPKASDAAVQKMVDEARAAYEANLAADDAETVTMDRIYDWSLRWMAAAQAAATDDVQKTAAIQAHLDRMRDLQKKNGLLGKIEIEGMRRGDARVMRAANFYVAEAERWLAEADTPATRHGLDAAKRGPAAEALEVVDLKIKIVEIAGEISQAEIELKLAKEVLDTAKKVPAASTAAEMARLNAEPTKLEMQLVYLGKRLALHTEKLKLIDTNSTGGSVPRELARNKPARREPADGGMSGVSKGVRFKDKDFDSWAEELRNELSPERRTAAIHALATFGASGYGPQAAAVILEAGRAYPLWIKSDGELALAAVGAFTMIPSKDSLPLVLKSLDSEVPGERLFAVNVLRYASPDQIETAQCLAAMLKDPDAGVRRAVTEQLVSYKPAPPEFVATLREWLASNEPDKVFFAARAACSTLGTGARGAKPIVDTKLLDELLPDVFRALERPDPYGMLVEQALNRLVVGSMPTLDAAIDSSGAAPGPRFEELLEKLRKKK